MIPLADAAAPSGGPIPLGPDALRRYLHRHMAHVVMDVMMHIGGLASVPP